MKTGIEIIAEERQRQILVEGWTNEHDKQHTHGELASAAEAYLRVETRIGEFSHPQVWPWDIKWWKPSEENPIRNLAKAGALIAAEIDRLQHLKEK